MAASPTSRTLARCREMGWTVDVVERWITIENHPGGGKRKDLFGFIDLIALRPGSIIGIQATSAANISNRLAKINEIDAVHDWFEAGGQLQVWGWRKYKKAVDGKWWRPRVIELRRTDDGVITHYEVELLTLLATA